MKAGFRVRYKFSGKNEVGNICGFSICFGSCFGDYVCICIGSF